MKLSELIEKYGDCEVVEEMLDMVEKVDDKGDWKPTYNETYWFVEDCGETCSSFWIDDHYDHFRMSKRNMYRTKEEAKKALEMYEFCKTRSFEPDWEDEYQEKHYLFLKYWSKTVDFACTRDLERFAPFYYPTLEAVEEIIRKYSFEELAKYYGRV